jgi:heptose-I-phosphate ethanolaminephosphotransferase
LGKILKLADKFIAAAGENFGFVAAFALMSLVPKLLQAHFINKLHHLPLAVFPPLFTAVLLAYLAEKFPQLKKILLTLILFVQAVLFAVEIFVLNFQHLMLNSAIMSPVVETSFREAMEFINTYLGWQVFLAPVILLFLAWAVQSVKIRLKSTKGLRLLMSALIVLGFLTTAREVVQGGQENSVREPWISLPVAVGGAYMEHKGIVEAEKHLDNAPNHIVKNEAKIKNVVLVIGEAESRHHMSIYGYGLPTTPFAEKWRKSGNLTAFSDVISAYSTTNPSLQHLFTFANYENSDTKWYNQSNLIDIAASSGYRTSWISSKDYKLAGSGMNWVFAKRAQTVRFTSDGGDYKNFGDWKLLEILQDELTRAGEKNFYVFHLMGSHANYAGRYPQDYAKFTADDVKKIRSDRDSVAATIAEYDNSVLYTDEFLDKLYREFADKEAIVIYLPDHAEDNYDGTASFTGHNPNGDKWQIEIPLLIWCSDEFIKNYPKTAADIKKSADNPYMTDDLIHTLLDIMAVETDETDKARSVVNPEFDKSRERVYQGKSYDTEMK